MYIGSNVTLLDWKAAYPFLIAYGASGAATVLPCIAFLIATPDAAVSASPLAVTLSQRVMLLASYVPFTLIPLCLAVDLSTRTVELIRTGLAAQVKKKAH